MQDHGRKPMHALSLSFCVFIYAYVLHYTIIWSSNLTPFFLQTIEFDEGAGAVLRIQPLRAPRDENIYECVAENSEGEVSVQAKLTIIRGKTACSVHIRALGNYIHIHREIIYVMFYQNSFLAWLVSGLSVRKYIHRFFFVISRSLNVKQLIVWIAFCFQTCAP